MVPPSSRGCESEPEPIHLLYYKSKRFESGSANLNAVYFIFLPRKKIGKASLKPKKYRPDFHDLKKCRLHSPLS